MDASRVGLSLEDLWLWLAGDQNGGRFSKCGMEKEETELGSVDVRLECGC